jgi:hypothetical protein
LKLATGGFVASVVAEAPEKRPGVAPEPKVACFCNPKPPNVVAVPFVVVLEAAFEASVAIPNVALD